MNPKHHSWKVLKLFAIAVTAAVLISGFSKAAPVQFREISEQTIEDRLARIREELKKRLEQIPSESYLKDDSEIEENKTFLNQWPISQFRNFRNYPFRDFRNYPFRNFRNFRNYPFRDFRNYPFRNFRNY